MTLIICIILAILCLVLIVWIYSMKKQASNIGKELKATRNEQYNRQIKIALFDDDMEKMVSEINKNLDYQKMMKLENEKNRNQLKQSVSDIAHDLRTPLTVVKGNLFMLEKEENLSERGKEFVRISMEKTDTLRQMVDDFFELSVLESESFAVELEDIDVTVFLAQFVIDNEAVIRQRGLTPKINFPQKSIFIKADEMLLLRMCNNLLNNVLKYAKDEFCVEIILPKLESDEANTINDQKNSSYKQDAKQNIIRIIFSNKIAHSDDFDVEKLFNRTYRGDKARPAGGAGLGLYIVKLLAEKQGGYVSAEVEKEYLHINIDFLSSKMNDN